MCSFRRTAAPGVTCLRKKVVRLVHLVHHLRSKAMPPTLPRTLCSLSSLIVLAMFSTVACGDSPTAPSGNGNLVVQLTDDHTDNVEQVNIYFTSVTANSAGGPPETMTLVLSENPQDLLLLRDAVIPLATAVVEPGDYVSLRINLDADQSSVVEGGKTLPLQIPSGEIKILGGFTVSDNATTTVTLDFDAEASLVRQGNGNWLLKPVIAMEVAGP